MKYIYLALNWLFGTVFLLGGLVSLLGSPLAGISLIIGSGLLLPPVREFIHTKTKRSLNTKTRAFCLLIAFFGFVAFANLAQNEKEQAIAEQKAIENAKKAAEQRQATIDTFNADRESIMSPIREAFKNGEYQSVISLSSKYQITNDEELKNLSNKAHQEIARIEKEKTTERLLTELKKIPASELEKNQNMYQQLVKLHPDNQSYKDKVAYYSGKIEEEKQKLLAAEKRKKDIEMQFSSWDGSHTNLERVIKESMNDPDSYDHVKTVYWDQGSYLIVQTTFRGKNAFGGVVKNTVKAKVSLTGQVLEILEQY